MMSVLTKSLIALAVGSLSVAGAAGGEGTSTADIADVMEARERGTLPFSVSYDLSEWADGATTGTHMARVSLACIEGARLMRRVLPLAPIVMGGAPAEATLEHLLLEKDGRVIDLNRRSAPEVLIWRGKITRDNTDLVDAESILRFGFLSAGKPLSALLRQKHALDLGERVIHGFRCSGFRLDLLGTDVMALPGDVWLAESHGYFPVRIVQYMKGTVSHSLADSGEFAALEHSGSTYLPVLSLDVRELAQVGSAWFPQVAAMRFRTHKGSRERRLLVERDSLLYGSAVQFKGNLPSDVQRAVVSNALTGNSEVIGADPHAVSSRELDSIAEEVVRAGVASPESSLQPLVIISSLVAVTAGALLGLMVMRRRRAIQRGH